MEEIVYGWTVGGDRQVTLVRDQAGIGDSRRRSSGRRAEMVYERE